MNKLDAIQVSREVARQGGFAAAGRRLKISTPSVSRLVSELEDYLGVRLFLRSTRQISLTEEGEEFLNRACTLVDELDAISAEIKDRRSAPRGHLVVSSVVAFGQEMIAPAVPGFLAKYPDVTIDLHLENRHVDLIQENVDLAIRVGGSDGLKTSELKSRLLFSQKLIFVATPEFVERYGAPRDLEDIADRPTVKQMTGNWGVVNRLSSAGKLVEFRMPDTFVVNSPNAAINAVKSGHVMGLIGDYLVQDMLAQGQLQRLLPSYETEEQPVYAVFVHRNYMPAKLRAFIDHLVEMLR